MSTILKLKSAGDSDVQALRKDTCASVKCGTCGDVNVPQVRSLMYHHIGAWLILEGE